jgi:hypothetical protein
VTDPRRADPAATPRIGFAGAAKRDRPIFSEVREAWQVEVTPLPDLAAGDGRSLNGAAGGPRVSFEVRAEYFGRALGEFEVGRQQRVKRIEQDSFRDQQLALAVAQRVVEMLRAGEDDIFLPKIAAEFRR